MEKNQTLQEIAEYLSAQKEIALFSHISPDGDAIGSQCALAGALEKMGKTVYLYHCDPIPKQYAFLRQWSKYVTFTGAEYLPQTIIILDCATFSRSGLDQWADRFTDKTIVNIDHHLSNNSYGKYNYIQADAIANCENVYLLLKELRVPLEETIATALYLGLSTDSGSFKYDAVTPQSHLCAAELLEKGARKDLVRIYMYETVSRQKFMLQRYVYEHITFAADGRIAWCSISQNIMEELQATNDDLEGLINILKDVEGVEVAILLKEKSDCVKLSFRSKSWMDVNQLAQAFGGGGHLMASGATVEDTLEHTIARVLEKAQQMLEGES